MGKIVVYQYILGPFNFRNFLRFGHSKMALKASDCSFLIDELLCRICENEKKSKNPCAILLWVNFISKNTLNFFFNIEHSIQFEVF